MAVEETLAISAFDWGAAGLAAGKNPNDPKVRKELGQQFEALLVGQMLRSMREGGAANWAGGEEDGAGLGLIELAEQQLALAMAASGGLGLARLVEQALPQPPGQGGEAKAAGKAESAGAAGRNPR